MVSILARSDGPSEETRVELGALFGPEALVSPTYPFDLSDYYEREMGPGLLRTWVAFERLAPPDGLPGWKLACASVEDSLRSGESRRVNLDPGYLDAGKLVLASFKEAPDKIYMGRGVWAHTVLRYGFGRYEAPGSSFPDFRDGRFDRFMRDARRLYKSLLRAGEQP